MSVELHLYNVSKFHESLMVCSRLGKSVGMKPKVFLIVDGSGLGVMLIHTPYIRKVGTILVVPETS